MTRIAMKISNVNSVLRLATALTMVPLAGCDKDSPSDLTQIAGDADTLPGDSDQSFPYTLSLIGTSPISVTFGQSVDLRFRIVDRTNAVVPSRTVLFALTGTGGTLSVTERTTDALGVAMVRFTAGMGTTTISLTATALDANPVIVSLQIRGEAPGDLRVQVSSAARISVARAQIYVITAASGTLPEPCSALLAATMLPETPYLFVQSPIPGQHTFTDFPAGTGVAVVAYGQNAAGDRVAQGCDDGITILADGMTSASVSMTQLPAVFTGDLDALVTLNLGAALPQPYEGYVNTVTEILTSPAGIAAYYVLIGVDNAGFTTFMDWTPPGATEERQATLDEVLANQNIFGTWRDLTTDLDNELTTQLGEPYAAAKALGPDIRGLLSSFDVGSRVAIGELSETVANQWAVDESYQAIVYTWDQSCAVGDVGCARRPFVLDETGYAPLHAGYNVLTSYAPTTGATERYRAQMPPHLLPLSYGAVVMTGVSELVFPSVCDGCQNLTDVMQYLLDCATLGAWLSNWVNDLVGFSIVDAADTQAYCEAGVADVATSLEDDVIAMTAADAPALEARDANNSGGTFYLVDTDSNLSSDQLRDLSMVVHWVDPNDAAFSQDVSSPVTGKGRTAATDCDADTDCSAEQSCQLLASYLEVRALETTCKKAIGTVAGGDDCTQDNQCRSAKCVGATGAKLCFAACATVADCGGASCDAERTTLNLNVVRAGLGEAYGRGCAAP